MTDAVLLAALLALLAAAFLALACGLTPRIRVPAPVLLKAADVLPGRDPDTVHSWELQ